MNANAIFDSIFRIELAKSADPDAAEMMNRVAGATETAGPGKTGRPKNAPPSTEELQAELLQLRLKLNVDPENPLITSLVLDENDSCHLLIGSVLQLVMPDGSLQSVVLRDDVRVFPFG
jgi:hypothetical protein